MGGVVAPVERRGQFDKPPLMPLFMFLYCLFVKGLIKTVEPGIFYALQRLVAETTLSLMVLEERLRAASGPHSKNT